MLKSVHLVLPIGLAATSMMLQALYPARAQAETGSAWAPYAARYREVTASIDKSGHRTESAVVTEETRSTDGSLLTVRTQDGGIPSGSLWQACGRVLSLDYAQKRAVFSRNMPRKHSIVPSASPTGVKTIAGVQCDVYPLLSVPSGMTGSGSVCVDQARDVMVQTEMHLDSSAGHQDYVKELQSIDFNSPVDPAQVSVPAGFALLLPESGSSDECAQK